MPFRLTMIQHNILCINTLYISFDCNASLLTVYVSNKQSIYLYNL